jgi:hypothetical protein
MEHRTRIRIAAATTAAVLVGLSAAGLATRGNDTAPTKSPAGTAPTASGVGPVAATTGHPSVVTVPASVTAANPIPIDDEEPGESEGEDD